MIPAGRSLLPSNYTRKSGFFQEKISAVSRLQVTNRKEVRVRIKPMRIRVSVALGPLEIALTIEITPLDY